MTISLTDLIAADTQDQLVATQLGLLQISGFPTTAWQSGSLPRTLIENWAKVQSDQTNAVATVAMGGLLDLAATLPDTEWLHQLATSHYQITPKPAVFTEGTAVLADNGGGPYTILPGDLWIGPPGQEAVRYYNTTGGTLPLNGTLPLTFKAEFAGQSYNLGNGAITSLITSLPGVGVSNPSLPSGTWITVQGTDPEPNDSVVLRCKARWPTLGGGATALVYQGWALTAADAVTRVNVLEHYPVGGQVSIYVAGPNGGSAPADVTAVDSYIQVRRPLCVTVNVAAASNFGIAITGTIYVRQAFATTAQAAFATALAAYATALQIGGDVYVSKVIDLFMQTPGVNNAAGVQLNAASLDITLSAQQAAVFDVSGITWVSV